MTLVAKKKKYPPTHSFVTVKLGGPNEEILLAQVVDIPLLLHIILSIYHSFTRHTKIKIKC